MVGSSRSSPPAGTANGATSTVATTLARASPSTPSHRRPVWALRRMYAAHMAAPSSAKPIPARSSSVRSKAQGPKQPEPRLAYGPKAFTSHRWRAFAVPGLNLGQFVHDQDPGPRPTSRLG